MSAKKLNPSFIALVFVCLLMSSSAASAYPESLVVFRFPAIYQYQEGDGFDAALSLLTGGSKKWVAECVVEVAKISSKEYFPIVSFHTPDGENYISGFRINKGFFENFKKVHEGELHSVSKREKVEKNIFIEYEIWIEEDLVWSYVEYENTNNGFFSIAEFGIVESARPKFISCLEPKYVKSVADLIR